VRRSIRAALASNFKPKEFSKMQTIGLARLGRDAEVRFTPAGDAVANLSLAVNYGKKGADGNRPTQWIDASIWGKQAEALAPYLVKGSVHCFVLSDIHLETYQGKNGEGVKLVARVDNVELGPRVNNGDQGSAAPRQAAPAGGQSAPRPQPKPAPTDFDDDIPF
jgi:single-strand DNA-binding protein